ncbi:MAG: VanW family protein [Lachnospiraceae bacterium]
MRRKISKPIHRSKLRAFLGMKYYTLLRRIFWIKKRGVFARDKMEVSLPCTIFSHKTILRRRLKDVDMWMQENKIVNLKIAIKHIDGIIIKPNEVFSYWKLIGKPTKSKGYIDGMILHNGSFMPGTGGGLCQLSNLIFWMASHTPLTIVERHRHGYDVFPDSSRTQPFGSGATCFYPHGDLMIQNNTNQTFQISLSMDDEYLMGEIRSCSKPETTFKIIERNHEMRSEYWGGFGRYNELYKQEFDANNTLLHEELLVKNSAIMMYSPFLSEDL